MLLCPPSTESNCYQVMEDLIVKWKANSVYEFPDWICEEMWIDVTEGRGMVLTPSTNYNTIVNL